VHDCVGTQTFTLHIFPARVNHHVLNNHRFVRRACACRHYKMMLAQSSRTASAAAATRRAISSRQGRPAVLRIRAEVSTALKPFIRYQQLNHYYVHAGAHLGNTITSAQSQPLIYHAPSKYNSAVRIQLEPCPVAQLQAIKHSAMHSPTRGF
jgi:hypothetical protein